MDILGCQVSSQKVRVLGDYCFYKTNQRSAKEILFNYFLEVYGIEEVLDSRLMFYDDYNGDNYEEVFEKDFNLWLSIMENYFISNLMFLYRNWDECKKNFIDAYEGLFN
jgi:hypothetical protein